MIPFCTKTVYNDIITEFSKDVKKNMYMKKVYLLLSHRKWLVRLEKLIERLQACGVRCEIKLIEAGCEKEAVEAGIAVKAEILYVTDSAVVTGVLCQKELPVLAYLHEENRTQDFSEARYACEEAGELEPEYLERVFRRYKGLPWKILETERCVLRESVEDDAEAFSKIYAEPMVTEYMESLCESRVSERAYIREYIENVYAYYEFGVWTVILKKTGEIVGRAGLSVREGYELPELGYVIGVPWQRKGLAKEVCQGILRYAWDEVGFDEVQALIQPENKASISLAAALGFEKCGEVDKDGAKVHIFVRSKQ